MSYHLDDPVDDSAAVWVALKPIGYPGSRGSSRVAISEWNLKLFRGSAKQYTSQIDRGTRIQTGY